jgi:uncharacterized protein with gpF-like domain
MQTLNSTNQGITMGTMLNVVNKVRGYHRNRSDVTRSKDIVGNMGNMLNDA